MEHAGLLGYEKGYSILDREDSRDVVAAAIREEAEVIVYPGAGHVEAWDLAYADPALFDWLQREGAIAEAEMLRTFNCGIGMTVIIRREDAEMARELLDQAGETVTVLGEIAAGTGQVELRG